MTNRVENFYVDEQSTFYGWDAPFTYNYMKHVRESIIFLPYYKNNNNTHTQKTHKHCKVNELTADIALL